MSNRIEIVEASLTNRDAIINLLQAEKLPVEDLHAELSNFFVATDNGKVIGAIGLETYERNGLLRSLIVKNEYRKMKVAAELINQLEKRGKELGLSKMYLLTERAEGYFLKKGYETIKRDEAPDVLKSSSEFTHTCPSSATLMKKALQ